MPSIRNTVLGIAVVGLLPFAAQAETHTFSLDPVHSQIGFKVRHLISNVPGHFDRFTASVSLDPENVAGTLRMSATIETASVNTNNAKRDGHLQSPDFFDAEKHPKITFESKSAKAVGGDRYQVSGDLTMRGVTKAVTLDVEFFGVTTNPFTGTPMTGMDVTGELNRQDFGVNWNKTLDSGGVLVSDSVNLDIHVEATVPK